ncbi:DUF4123 domain-containing protein [Paraburkholderia lycopersici]|uniref:DUF4123 domain-containing protein n=1 Tax=Paraburkholderia lycopersici TaxID=416944 RepID=A0A1G7D602_9BURK|nr:DUF4123 domain-containing protein [Paraburkholderia lycopersici]SDE46933.1 protein of unknown function [Paraburkholderia lycopersici]
MIPDDIQSHLREHFPLREDLRVYVLVDGIQFHKHTSTAIQPQAGSVIALFAGTRDERLAPAGPWLIDPAHAKGIVRIAAEMEPALPGVVWLISALEIEKQAQALRQMIDMRLPNGRELMVRFWDPRALVSLYHSVGREKWRAHFGGVVEWHFIHQGNRIYIGNHA